LKAISLFEAVKEYKGECVINLWANQFRVKDIIGGEPQCPHNNVTNNVCDVCGAFVGFIGSEEWMTYIRHLMVISNILRGYKFVIISQRYVPEYINKFNNLFLGLGFQHHRKTYFCLKDKKYVTMFYDKSKESDYTLRVYKGGSNSFINADDVIINPDKKQIESFSNKMIICNSELEKMR